MIILRAKNVIFERFWPLSKFHFPACSTLLTFKILIQIAEEPKIEPDSTSEGVSFGTASSPPRRREDSPDPDCDSTNQQPDSTTTDSSKEDTNAEDKADEAESIQTVENRRNLFSKRKWGN